MSKPSWLPSQIADRNRSVEALGAAADQKNTCMRIAADLKAKGREHTTDPFWQSAAREVHRLEAVAEAYGFDEYAVADEAKRRRS